MPASIGTLGFLVRIEKQHNPGDLRPVGMSRRGIEEAGIGNEIVLVIRRDLARPDRRLGNGNILDHSRYPIEDRCWNEYRSIPRAIVLGN